MSAREKENQEVRGSNPANSHFCISIRYTTSPSRKALSSMRQENKKRTRGDRRRPGEEVTINHAHNSALAGARNWSGFSGVLGVWVFLIGK
jgi:hypothetical protein